MKLTSEEKKAKAEERKRRFKQWWANVFKTVKFLIRFAAILAILLVLDQAGGAKLVVYVFLAFIITSLIVNYDTIREMVLDILIKLFG
jgi:hypothetical protein